MKKSWFKMQAKAGAPKAASIDIYDEIGFWGVTAQSFVNELKALGDVETLDVFINSPGGSVFDGLVIYNALRMHKATVNVTVMGVAASAASFIAMAGDKITMPENTFLMVHNPIGIVYGNAEEMRDTAEVLDKIGASLIGIYMARSGKSEAEVKALLDAETYMTAKEAKDLGFADEVTAEMKIAASFDIDKLSDKMPAAALAAFRAAVEPDPEDDEGEEPGEQGELFADEVAALAKAAGFEKHAPLFALNLKTIDAVKSRIAECREITAVCALVNKANLADSFIEDGKTFAEVKTALIDARASVSEASPVDTTQRNPSSPAPTQPSAVKATTADIWAKRRNLK